MNNFDNRTYYIINRPLLTAFRLLFPHLWLHIEKTFLETYGSARRSLDDQKIIFKIERKDHEDYIEGHLDTHGLLWTKHTHAQILTIIETTEWTPA